MFYRSQEFQELIKAVSFKDVVVSGRELTGALITALINIYIKDSASVDTVSTHLRDICPLLYSSDDCTCSKVTLIPYFLSLFLFSNFQLNVHFWYDIINIYMLPDYTLT